MRVDPKRTFAGIPAIKVRDFLRRSQMDRFESKNVQEQLGVSSKDIETFLNELQNDELIKPSGRAGYWELTDKGVGFSYANATKPIGRKTAERKLKELLERVLEVNANSEFAYQIARVVVFGSYLTDSPTLSDIDLVVSLRARHQDKIKQERLESERISKGYEKGKCRSIFERAYWPRLEVWSYLKGRSHVYSFHTEDDLIGMQCKQTVLFEETTSGSC